MRVTSPMIRNLLHLQLQLPRPSPRMSDVASVYGTYSLLSGCGTVRYGSAPATESGYKTASRGLHPNVQTAETVWARPWGVAWRRS